MHSELKFSRFIALSIILIHLFSFKIGFSQSTPTKLIKVNQVGYLTNCEKLAVIVVDNNKFDKFYIKSTDLKTTYYENILIDSLKWSSSNETVKKAYFTEFNVPGKYVIEVTGLGYSYPFEIKSNLYSKLNVDAIRYFYLNRASTDIPAQYGGVYARAAGHPDTAVIIHSSAASASRPAGTTIKAPKGWYDAGDFGSYTVNSGISTYTLMLSYELNKPYFDTLNLNIPESKNTIPDILDEAKWNLDWMLDMQDPNDGGVYFKKVSLEFAPFILPSSDKDKRYMVNKSTTSTLDFVAVMCYASRLFQPYDTAYANKCLKSAKYAYQWALQNPKIYATNPPDDKSGGYGDQNTTDEFYWSEMELYITTKDDSYFPKFLKSYQIAEWPNVAILGLYSLEINKTNITQKGLDSLNKAQDFIVNLAKTNQTSYNNSAYKVIPFGFYWGSNAVLLNTLLNHYMAFKINNDYNYVKAVANSFDYLLGKNGPAISYITGYGTYVPRFPHHRISYALGKVIPGMVVGGANPRNTSDCGGASSYPSTYGALAYLDNVCSYSTNETAINWNAPLVAVVTAILKEYSCNAEIEYQSFTNFEISKSDCDVKISFSSKNETSVESYFIEKSTDGKTFTRLAQIANTLDSTYNFTDTQIGLNKVYYRVISKTNISNDTKFYGNTDIKNLDFTNIQLDLYPTLTQNFVNVDLACYTSAEFSIYSDLGRYLDKGTLTNTKNKIDLSGYNSGIYVIILTLNGKEYTKRIVKI